ncbi:MAG: cytochrome c biogenesis protein CcdA [Oscillospiraceae bacterium]|nr:cytochrome c biogenesis protein CcdA [Oscillospiraceae bacterium]
MQYLFTFSEGMLAFVSPCILPMLPIFLAYISADEKQSLSKRFINTLFFVLGFTTAFVAMGATAFSLASFLSRYKTFLIKLAGVMLVFFGFVYMDFITLNIGGSTAKKEKSGFLSNFLFGVSYSFGWTPCMGAFLGSALALAGVQETVIQGMLLLACFGLGLGVPFIVFSLMYERLKSVVNFLKIHSEKIKTVGGVILILVGLAMIFDLLGYYLAIFT